MKSILWFAPLRQMLSMDALYLVAVPKSRESHPDESATAPRFLPRDGLHRRSGKIKKYAELFEVTSPDDCDAGQALENRYGVQFR
jgi:hypothetical protein